MSETSDRRRDPRIQAGNDSHEEPIQIARANLTEALPVGGSASFEFWKYDGTQLANLGIGHSFKVHDLMEYGPFSVGDKIHIIRLGDFRQWETLSCCVESSAIPIGTPSASPAVFIQPSAPPFIIKPVEIL